MNLLLERFSYSTTETEGRLIFPPLEPLYTMEQPFVWAEGFKAGIPYKSCIFEGTYDLVPYERTNGQKVWAMVNESLGVYFKKSDTAEEWHRFNCLWHPGNIVSHTAGCVLPGTKRGWLKGERAVLNSGFRPGYAMDIISKLLTPMSEGHTVTITQVEGAI